METFVRKLRNRPWYLGLLVMLLSVAGLMPPVAMAQQATANVNGVVKDPSGAAIANAQIELTNVNTEVVRKTSTNTGEFTISRASCPEFIACRYPQPALPRCRSRR
jgi:type 1 fimbria pilin